MGTSNPDEAIDYVQLMKHLWDTGKILCDVYHQQSLTRKSFITPILDKDIRPTLDASVADEWLYGQKITEQVKDAKAIEKASITLKAPEKQGVKKTQQKTVTQGNWRSLPVRYMQVGGHFPKKQFANVRYRPKTTTTRPFQRTSNNEKRQMSNKK